MDHTRDNPLKRFTAFWIALLLVFSFAVAMILLRPMTHHDSTSADEVISSNRLKVKREVDSAQDDALNSEALQEALTAQLKSFPENTVEKGSRAVPPTGSPAPMDASKKEEASSESN